MNRDTAIHASIWAGLWAITLLLLLLNMPLQYSLIRASVIIGWFMLGHYINRQIFNYYVPAGQTRKYLFALAGFAVLVTIIRYVAEQYILSEQTQPFFFGGGPIMRPFFILTSTFVVCFISTMILFALHYSAREKEILRLMNVDKEAKLQYLHAQINPHFLFNALNNIYSLSLTGSPRTPEMLLTLTDILRYSVYQKERKKVAVMEEADQIEFLIRLFNLKTDDAYKINFQRGNVHAFIEPMILVPLAENCLKHCDFEVNENAYAIMKLDVDKNTITFTTENTFSKGVIYDKVGGVGRANIIERLNLVYGDKHKLITTEGPHIYKVELSIQWNS